MKKKMSLAMVLLIVCMLLSFTAAFATIISNTAQRFGNLYGEGWTDAALRGDIDTSKPSIQVGDVIYTMDDVIVTGIALEDGGLAEDDGMCSRILATGTMRSASGANVVLMPEDYLVSDPWNFDPYYNGHANVPAGSVSVLEKANETGAKMLCTRATANGLVDNEGNLYDSDIVYAGIVQEDGSVMFILDIGLFEPIPRQESYTLSVYISNHQVTAENEHLMDTRVSEDWIFTIHPQQSPTQQPVEQSQVPTNVGGVLFASWEDTVSALLVEPVTVTVLDPNTNTAWQMQALVADSGNYADAKPVSTADIEAMVSAFGSTLTPHAVFVTFPNDCTCLGTLGSWGYAPEQNMVYEDGTTIENKQVAYIHFPRNAENLNPGGYGAAHQAALAQAWKHLQQR